MDSQEYVEAILPKNILIDKFLALSEINKLKAKYRTSSQNWSYILNNISNLFKKNIFFSIIIK